MPRRPALQPEALTVRQTADVLGVRQRTTYNYVRKGLIPSFRVGHRILILRRVIDTLMARGDFPPHAAREPW